MIKRSFISLILFLLLLTSTNGKAQVNEAELKSVFLERFSRFMEWPEQITDTVFIIKVVDNKEMYEVITKTYKERTINGLKVSVELLDEDSVNWELNCHILYVGNCFNKKNDFLIDKYRKAGALIIGHEGRCLNEGVTLAFIKENNKIMFGYNELALKENKVSISYKLLQLAKTH